MKQAQCNCLLELSIKDRAILVEGYAGNVRKGIIRRIGRANGQFL